MVGMAKRTAIALVTLAFVLTTFIMAFEPVLRGLGHVLITDEPIAQSDAIILPNWTGTPGALEAADLVHQGISKHVLVLMDRPPNAYRELVRRGIIPDGDNWLVNLLRALGVDDVRVVQNSGNGTSEEAFLLPDWLALNHIRSAVVISTPDHSKRMRRLLRRSFDSSSVQMVVKTTRYSDFDPNDWWRSRSGLRAGVEELQKLLLDIVQHPIS